MVNTDAMGRPHSGKALSVFEYSGSRMGSSINYSIYKSNIRAIAETVPIIDLQIKYLYYLRPAAVLW